MSLLTKLNRLNGTNLGGALVPPPMEVPQAREEGNFSALAQSLKQPKETPTGPLFVADRLHLPSHRQGHVALADAVKAQASTLANLARDDSLSQLEPNRMLLLDTETTGLHGGTGTLPFLVGLAWFENGAFRVHQLFLRRPGEEAPMLHFLAEKLSESSMLVTYNGKTFDWPLLKSRFVLNRVPLPEPKPHFDLLHVCRRIFKPRLQATRLKLLESDVLRHDRGDDIDGALIPQTYFDFLRDQNVSKLDQVLEHNVQDLVSLVALVAELARRFERVIPSDHPQDILAMAQLLHHAGKMEQSRHWAEQALEQSQDESLSAQAMAFLSRLMVWDGRHSEAAAMWASLTRLRAAPAWLKSQAHLNLAKWSEHRLRQPVKALEHAREAYLAEDAVSHARRLARLTRKLEHRRAQDASQLRLGE